MTDYVESGVRLIADTDDYTSKVEDAISLADSIDELSPTLTIDAQVGDTGAIDEVTALDGASIDTTLNTSEGGDKVGGKSLLTTLHELGVNPVEIVMNVVGTILDVIGAINTFSVQPMLDLDDAVAKFNGHTNTAIPNARELFRDILYDDLGDSVEQIGEVATKAAQIKAPIEEATRAALTFTHTWQDEDPTQVLTTMDMMVKNNLAKDFNNAGDLLTVAFQNGANAGGDLLTTIQNNAGAIKDLGLDGQEAMQLFTAGQEAGFDSAQDLLNTLIKIKQNVTNAAGNADSDVSTTLKALGIANPAETGEAWSLDFFMSVIDGIKNAAVSDTDKQAMFSNLLGSKVGAKEFSNLMRLSPEDWETVFENVDGAAETAATTVDDSLRGAWEDFMLDVQAFADGFLSSEQIDLPGKIEALKKGLQDGLSVLQEGGTLGEAIKVTLEPLGFDDEFQKLESALLQFLIGLNQVALIIQNITGNTAGATQTKDALSGLSQEKLKLDLQLADPEKGFSTALAAAVANGITSEGINTAVSEAVAESLATGDVGQAQSLVDRVVGDTDLGSQLQQQIDDYKQQVITASIEAQKEALAESEKTRKAGAIETPDIRSPHDTSGAVSEEDLHAQVLEIENANSKISDMAEGVGELKTPIDDATTATTNLTTAQTEQTTVVHGSVMATGDATKATALHVAAMSDEEKAAYLAELTVQALKDQMILLGNAAEASANQFANAATTLNSSKPVGTVESSAPATPSAGGGGATLTKAGGGQIPGGRMSWVGERGAELIAAGRDLSVLNNRTSRALMQALSGMPYMALGQHGGTRNQNLTVINNVQSNSQAMNISYDIGQQVRGF